MIHTVKGFGIVNKAEIDVFLELSCFFHDPADVIGLENILCWNLVESALERGDSNVPVYSPFLIFLFAILVHDVNKSI